MVIQALEGIGDHRISGTRKPEDRELGAAIIGAPPPCGSSFATITCLDNFPLLATAGLSWVKWMPAIYPGVIARRHRLAFGARQTGGRPTAFSRCRSACRK